MDVSRGDRVLEPGQAVELNGARTWYVVGPCHRYPGNTVIQNGNGDLRSAPPTALSPIPPEVVTLTLSYRGHEVSEEMALEEWRSWAGWPNRGRAFARAARALAEKVDGEDQ